MALTVVRLSEVGDAAPECQRVLDLVRSRTRSPLLAESGRVLKHEWGFLLETPDKLLVELGKFSTTAGFKAFWDALKDAGVPGGVACHMFRHGARPLKSNEVCEMGGRWVTSEVQAKDKADVWSTLLLGLIYGDFTADDDYHFVVGASLRPNSSIELWTDGGFFAGGPSQEEIEKGLPITEQVRAMFEAKGVPLVPFTFTDHAPEDLFERTSAGLFRPKKTQAAVMPPPEPEDAAPRDKPPSALAGYNAKRQQQQQHDPASRQPEAAGADEGSRRTGAFPAKPSGNVWSRAKDGERPFQQRTYVTFEDRPFGRHREEENGAEKHRPADREKEEAEQEAEREAELERKRELKTILVKVYEQMRKLLRASEAVDAFREQKKQLEAETATDGGDPLNNSSSWADDYEHATAVEEAAVFKERYDDVKLSRNVSAAKKLSEDLASKTESLLNEGHKTRATCCDLLTEKARREKIREHEGMLREMEKKQRAEDENKRRKIASTGLSSMVAQAAVKAQERREEEANLRAEAARIQRDRHVLDAKRQEQAREAAAEALKEEERRRADQQRMQKERDVAEKEDAVRRKERELAAEKAAREAALREKEASFRLQKQQFEQQKRAQEQSSEQAQPKPHAQHQQPQQQQQQQHQQQQQPQAFNSRTTDASLSYALAFKRNDKAEAPAPTSPTQQPQPREDQPAHHSHQPPAPKPASNAVGDKKQPPHPEPAKAAASPAHQQPVMSLLQVVKKGKSTQAKETQPAVDTNKQIMKEKMEAMQREHEKKEKAEKRKAEQALRRAAKQRADAEEKEADARAAVDAEWTSRFPEVLQEMDRAHEGAQAREAAAEAVRAEEARGLLKEQEAEAARRKAANIIKACNREEELHRLRIGIAEDEDRDAVLKELAPELSEVNKALASLKRQERAEEEKEKKRLERERKQKAEEDRARKREQRQKEELETIKKMTAATSLVSKCKPTVFDAFASDSEGDHDPAPKPKKAAAAGKKQQPARAESPAAKPPPKKQGKPAAKKQPPPQQQRVDSEQEAASSPPAREDGAARRLGGAKKAKKPKKKKAGAAGLAHEDDEEENEEEAEPAQGTLVEIRAALSSGFDALFGDNERMILVLSASFGFVFFVYLICYIFGL